MPGTGDLIHVKGGGMGLVVDLRELAEYDLSQMPQAATLSSDARERVLARVVTMMEGKGIVAVIVGNEEAPRSVFPGQFVEMGEDEMLARKEQIVGQELAEAQEGRQTVRGQRLIQAASDAAKLGEGVDWRPNEFIPEDFY